MNTTAKWTKSTFRQQNILQQFVNVHAAQYKTKFHVCIAGFLNVSIILFSYRHGGEISVLH